MRAFTLICSSNVADTAKSLMKRLEADMGKPVVVEEVMQPDALDKLKQLSGKFNGR